MIHTTSLSLSISFPSALFFTTNHPNSMPTSLGLITKSSGSLLQILVRHVVEEVNLDICATTRDTLASQAIIPTSTTDSSSVKSGHKYNQQEDVDGGLLEGGKCWAYVGKRGSSISLIVFPQASVLGGDVAGAGKDEKDVQTRCMIVATLVWAFAVTLSRSSHLYSKDNLSLCFIQLWQRLL
jgi:hypothetical protein